MSSKTKQQIPNSRSGGKNGKSAQRKNGSMSQTNNAIPVSSFASFNYRAPRINRTNRQSCTMAHSEFIGDITGSVAFTVASSIAINPGLSTSFPWLSIEAAGWERYRFKRLTYYYTTACASTTPGSLIMSPDYDAADAAPASQVVALDYKDRSYCAPWTLEQCANLKPADMDGAFKQHFVRTTALGADQDIKTYDSGNLFVCTVGGTATPWGKLFVDYEVEFFNPQLPSSGNILGQSAVLIGTAGLSQTAPWGTSNTATTLGPNVISASGLVLSITNCSIGQEYLVSMCMTGTVLSAFTNASRTGCTLKTSLNNLVNAGATQGCHIFTVTATDTTMTFTQTMTATTVTFGWGSVGIVPTSTL